MNAETHSSAVPISSMPIEDVDWRHWARRLLVCNPFFLCSAALLLLGVSKLSADPNFLGDEKANLLFNFGALESYELLVVGTALLLAWRKIWYDSALLVVIEHGLVLTPFFLISHSIVITRSLGLAFAATAFVLATGRMLAVRRFHRDFNLPTRAVLLGAVVLLLNASLPFAFWPWVEADMDRWLLPNKLLWYQILPLMAAGALLLPKPRRSGERHHERSWLPLFLYGLWIAGSAVHVWCVGYVCKIDFDPRDLGPLALMASWVVWWRIGDCVPNWNEKWSSTLLGITCVMPLISAGNSLLFEMLVSINAVAYVIVFARTSGLVRKVARELIFASAVLLVAGLPARLFPTWLGTAPHETLVTMALMLYCLRWPRPITGVLATMGIVFVLCCASHSIPGPVAVQIPTLFLLLHSLTWRGGSQAPNAIRAAAGIVWLLSAFTLVSGGFMNGSTIASAEGFLIVSAAVVARILCGEWRGGIWVPLSGVVVMLLGPVNWLVREASAGVIALVASVVLFGSGTLVAWTRRHWSSVPQENSALANHAGTP